MKGVNYMCDYIRDYVTDVKNNSGGVIAWHHTL